MTSFSSVALDGQNIVIFGGTSGMGLETARACLACGAAHVWVTGRNPDRAAAAERGLGEAATAVAFNMANSKAITQLMEEIPRVDHVYVPAGDVDWGPVTALSEEKIRAQFEQRVFPLFQIVREALPKMPEHGSFVLSSGTVLVRPAPDAAHVTSAVGAVQALVPGLVSEIRPRRINVIMPGAVDTPMLRTVLKSRSGVGIEALAKSIPTGKVGTSLDLASAAVWLMSNAFVNGATLVMDGGARWVSSGGRSQHIGNAADNQEGVMR